MVAPFSNLWKRIRGMWGGERAQPEELEDLPEEQEAPEELEDVPVAAGSLEDAPALEPDELPEVEPDAGELDDQPPAEEPELSDAPVPEAEVEESAPESAPELEEPEEVSPESLGVDPAAVTAQVAEMSAQWSSDYPQEPSPDELEDEFIRADQRTVEDEDVLEEPKLLPGGDIDFLAIVTGSSALTYTYNGVTDGQPCQWTYTIQRIYKSGLGYGASDLDGEGAIWTRDNTSLGAFNMNENINALAGENGTFGNGIAENYLDPNADEVDDFALQPIPDDTPVLVRPITVAVTSGDDTTFTTEYWIVGSGIPNGVHGTCPP